MSSETLHERIEVLPPETLDLHRAIVSLMEELEAVDWYQQRVDATSDAELKAVLAHNRDEEIEHAMMNLEWIRRNSPAFDAAARTYLFFDGPITEAEKAAKAKAGGGDGGGSNGGGNNGGGAAKTVGSGRVSPSLGIGGLRHLVSPNPNMKRPIGSSSRRGEE